MTGIPDNLNARLLRWARGQAGIERAVRLLTTTPWVEDPTFVAECIVAVDDDIACIDWIAVGQFSDRLSNSPDPEPEADATRALRLADVLARTPDRPPAGTRASRCDPIPRRGNTTPAVFTAPAPGTPFQPPGAGAPDRRATK